MKSQTPANIDTYIAAFPKAIQNILADMRTTIQQAAPQATETISYGMPTFVQNGILVHFAAFKNHIGFYATPDGNAAFKNRLSKYKGGKGSVQFPLNQPVPLSLIADMVR